MRGINVEKYTNICYLLVPYLTFGSLLCVSTFVTSPLKPVNIEPQFVPLAQSCRHRALVLVSIFVP